VTGSLLSGKAAGAGMGTDPMTDSWTCPMCYRTVEATGSPRDVVHALWSVMRRHADGHPATGPRRQIDPLQARGEA
jgi:hypothetical protein